MSNTGVPKIASGEHAYVTFDGKTLGAPAWFAASARKDGVSVYLHDVDKDAWRTGSLSAKKARKFAKALLKLADEVDPPKPKTRYFQIDGDLFYRVVKGETPELFQLYGKKWVRSDECQDAEGVRSYWEDDVFSLKEITKKELPEEAR